MTTHAPAYYRDILKSIIDETTDYYQLPHWFRTAWHNDHVQVKPQLAADSYLYICNFPVQDKWLTKVSVTFRVHRHKWLNQRPTSYHIGDIEGELFFGKVSDPNDPAWESAKGRVVMIDSQNILQDILAPSLSVKYYVYSWGLYHNTPFARIGFHDPCKSRLRSQLQPGAEQLFHWAEEIER